MNNHKVRLFAISFLIIAAAVLAVYQNSLHSPFIWDDEASIVKNPVIKDRGLLFKAFTSDLYSGVTSASNFYRPIQTISYAWDYYFWQLDPFGYHITNIILQILVSTLVLLFVYGICGNGLVSFATSLLFALSPLSTESVTYISGRAELLLGLFLLSSLLIFIKSQNTKKSYSTIYLYLSLFLFVLGLLSKELALVFPLAISAYIFYFRRADFKKRDFFYRQILPFFIIAAIYIALRLSFLNFQTIRPSALAKFPLIVRITALPKAIFTYIELFILPVNLHMSRALFIPTNFIGIFLLWFLLGAIISACAYILIYKRDKKIAPFMLSWALLYLLPQSGIFPINAFIAEHFIYLSSLSFFMLVSYLFYRYLRKELFILSIAGLSIFYGALTSARNFQWLDPRAFYEKIVEASPESFQAHNNLGLQYEYAHLYDKAIGEYKKALDSEPGLLEGHSNLANLYFKMGRLEEAKREYAIVAKTAPGAKAGEIQNNIGCVYEVEGRLEEALDKYKLSLRLDPGLHFAHFNIARIYYLRGTLSASAEEILKSLPEINSAAERPGPYLKIIEGYLNSIKTVDCSATFYNNLGVRFAGGNFLDAATVSFKRVLEVEPQYADAHFNLGLAYWKKGSRRKAAFEFKSALKFNPRHPKAARFLSEMVYKK